MDARKARYQTQFQPLMNRCKDMVVVYVNALMSELFANSDDALTSFARKAETNEVQNRFFDAMAAIRNRHGLVEHEFRESITEGFDSFWSYKIQDDPQQPEEEAEEELKLVDRESMDINTAMENIVNKAVGTHRGQLYALGQRLAVINGGEGIKHQQIPAGPHHLAHAFSDAIDSLGMETRIKIIVLALFDKYVLKQLGDIYENFNNTLKDAGVLPHLRPSVQKSESAYDPRSGSPNDENAQAEQSQPQTQEELGEELFGSILELLANRRRHAPATTGRAVATGSAAPPASSGPPVSADRLITALSEIQPAQRADYMPDASGGSLVIPNIEVDEKFLTRIKHTLIEERHKLYNQIGEERLDAADEDTIDLVGMLFEYMLNDPVLPAVAKALISHLHTPYLKVAIIDRQLLTDSNHDARQLLDSLVEAGSHWIDERNLKRGIYPDMQNVIDRVLKEFADDLSIFHKLLATFRKKMDEFRRKSDILEKRAQDSIKGREKLNIARQRATQEMKARSFNKYLPQAARDFLEQTWVDKLIFILLRHPEGELSNDWKDALRVADEITWIFEPKETVSEKRELEENLPKLRESIEEGLASLGGFHQEKSNTLFELIANSSTVTNAATQAASRPAAKPEPEQPPPADSSVSSVSDDTTLLEAETADAEESIPAEEEAMMEKLRKIQFGTWFEFPAGDGEESQRVKLSWLSPLTSTCMFVDRAGVQTAIKPLRTLAQEIIAGKATILEDSNDPFVERTLVAIRKMLQRSLKATDSIANEIINSSDNNQKAP
jgi:hypothetical protein